jgi:IPT/TIG domain
MTIHSASGQRFSRASLLARTRILRTANQVFKQPKRWIFLAGLVVFASMAVAQNAPQITSVDPSTGKVNDTIVVSGSNLGKGSVASVYLSDDKNDFKATIVDQSNEKITVKVPQVKPGDYNVSLEVGDKLFIKPVKFKVEQ